MKKLVAANNRPTKENIDEFYTHVLSLYNASKKYSYEEINGMELGSLAMKVPPRTYADVAASPTKGSEAGALVFRTLHLASLRTLLLCFFF